MLFYKQPELLNHQAHRSLGLRRPDRPYDFARSVRAVPLTLGELPAAQKHFPVVFADLEHPIPLAVLGAADDVNLFVDENGFWEQQTYVPAYVRCYPFALAPRSDDEFAVVIDRAADCITDSPEQPFFENDKVTPQTQTLIDFCGQYDAETKLVAQFGLRLKELGLLAAQQVSTKSPGGGEQTMVSYVAVDSDKLNELDEGVVKELFDTGYLAGVLAHLFSLENWQMMLERHARIIGSEAPAD